MRLLADVCLMLAGRRMEAALDLAHWSRRRCCPIDARVLLAVIQLDEGQYEAALQSIHRNLNQIDDPKSFRCAIIAHLMRGEEHAANMVMRRLRESPARWDEHGHANLWLQVLGLSEKDDPAEAPASLARQLAVELLSCEHLIPSVAAGLSAGADIPVFECRLLHDALAFALPDLERRDVAYECLARLAQASGDTARCRQWIIEGLEHDPLSAVLAVMLIELPPPPAAPSSLSSSSASRTSSGLNSDSGNTAGEIAAAPHRGWPEPDERKAALEVVMQAFPEWEDLRRVRHRLEAA